MIYTDDDKRDEELKEHMVGTKNQQQLTATTLFKFTISLTIELSH